MSGTVDPWEHVYRSRAEEQRSWSEAQPSASLSRIAAVAHRMTDPIIDVGGGASRLVDELLATGHRDVTVLDVAPSALVEARERLAEPPEVSWIVADVRSWVPSRRYAIWHDRAVFHFLVDPADRGAYVRCAADALVPGGSLIVATFALDGPATCTGLDVRRYAPEELESTFSDGFAPVERGRVEHVTPWGSVQPFSWVVMTRRATP